MTQIVGKVAIATACIFAAACSPSAPPEEKSSDSATVPVWAELAQPTAAKHSSAQTPTASAPAKNLPKVSHGGCREEPAGDRSTAKMVAMGTFGGVTLYGSSSQLLCSEPGANQVGECELSANSVAIAKEKTGS